MAERPDEEAEKERRPRGFLRALLDGDLKPDSSGAAGAESAGAHGAAGTRRLPGAADPRRAVQRTAIDSPDTEAYRRRASRWDGLRPAPLGSC